MLVMYYLGCAALAYNDFIKPLPSMENSKVYTGTVLRAEVKPAQFGGDHVNIYFSDGARARMDESFRPGQISEIRTGDSLTVLYDCPLLNPKNMSGYALMRNKTVLHDLDETLLHLQRERRASRMTTVCMVLMVPVGWMFGRLYEDSLFDERKARRRRRK